MEIEPRRPIANVIAIHADAIDGTYRVPPGNLPQSRESRSYPAVQRKILPVGRYFLFDNRTRTHQTHLSTQDIPHLRKLVEAGPSQEPAHPRNARIMPQLTIARPFVAHDSILQ